MKRMLVAIIVSMLMFNVAAACDRDLDCDVILVDEIDTDQDVQEWKGNGQ